MTNGSDRSLKFYCLTHRIRFQAPGQPVIPCEQGGHTVGSGFPASSWWEFCCDCGTYWPTDPASGSLQRTECLVCERPLAKRYLCTKCQVVSIESSALVRRKTYSIQDSGIAPDCPGCATAPNGQLHEHDCAEANVRLLTSRNSCPFCESQLAAKESSQAAPVAAARVKVCPICDTRQKPGNLFCGRCGKPLPEALPAQQAREGAARREVEKTGARQKTADARRLASSEALRVAEEQRRGEQEAKRKADEERIAQTARETAAGQSTMAAAIEAGKKAYQEEKRKVQLAEEARRRDEEEQLRAREMQGRAEAEAARQTAEEEERRTAAAEAERIRQEEEARALAEQERQRVREAQRQQAEHERLTAELHRRAKEDEARRAAEAKALQPDQQGLTTPDADVVPGTELEDNAQPFGAPIEEVVQIVGPQPASDVGDDGAVVTIEQVANDASQQTSEAELNRHPTLSAEENSSKDDSLGSAAPADTTDVKVPEYTPSWHQPSAFSVPPPRRVPWVWISGALVVLIVGVIVAASFSPRANTDNTNVSQSTPTRTAPGIPAGMVFVPGGQFLMGTDSGKEEDEKPAHPVTVKSFYIDVYEVTCEEYQKFVKATSHRIPPNWIRGQYPNGAAKQPVTGVDWDDATAYARWAGKRLPTEEEWEFAARGTDGRKYPWGNEWKNEAANAANTAHKHLAEVGEHKEGPSPFGAFDMVGNAWEWTATEWKGYPNGSVPPDASNESRVIRGGYWGSSASKATTTFRRGWPARDAKEGYKNTGFRCAADVNAQTK